MTQIEHFRPPWLKSLQGFTVLFTVALMPFFAFAADASSPVTGLPLLDQAMAERQPLTLLPLWHEHPWAKVSNSGQWTRYVVQIVRTEGNDLVDSNPSDVGWYCPNYLNLDRQRRIIFWARFISALSETESGFNPEALYQETFDPIGVHSVGVMMLGVSSVQQTAYRCDWIHDEEDLKSWSKNLHCAIRIMNYEMSRNNVISWNSGTDEKGTWEGLAGYWGPLRESRVRTAEGRAAIQQMILEHQAAWQAEAAWGWHPAYKDAYYRAQNESKFERIVRLMNEVPFCH